jgi:hypothetical protein
MTKKIKKMSQLIKELISNPVEFENHGRGNELLKCFEGGESLNSLRPLLSHENSSVRGTAMFVVSELGTGGCQLLDAIIPLVEDSDPHIAWDAMESVFLCSNEKLPDSFFVVVRKLESPSGPLRRLAMRLISKASPRQLIGARNRLEEFGKNFLIHGYCLQVLINGKTIDYNSIKQMLDCDKRLVRLYGAIAANRLFQEYPDLLELASLNTDPDVQKFVSE